MGVYIPNMEKPKNCRTCNFKSNKEGECWFVHYDIDCPLIEIIRCGECKYWHNHEWSSTCDKNIGNGFPSDYFCADGERRADDNKRRSV